MSETLDGVPVGHSEAGPIALRLDRANRHGLVAGATGTGKTVTLQVLAEGFSRAGVPHRPADPGRARRGHGRRSRRGAL